MNCASSTSRARGFTLVEVLVVMGLGLLILGLIHNFLMQTYRYVLRSTTQAEMQQFATLAMFRLEKDLELCDQSGVSFDKQSTSSVLACHPVDKITPSRHKLYSDKLAVYTWDGATLSRRIWPPAPPALAPIDVNQGKRLTPSELGQMLSMPNGTAQSLCASVVDFDVQMDGPPRFSQPIKVILVLRRSVSSRDEIYRMERFICLRNAL